MKRTLVSTLALIMAIGFISCAPEASLKAGSATSVSLLRLLPVDARGVIMIDLHRAVASAGAADALKNEQAQQRLAEVVKMTGIDPMKDIYFLEVGIIGPAAGMKVEGVVIVNLKYNKDLLLAKVKATAVDLQEEPYNGVTIYKSPAMKGRDREAEAAFLDDSNIAVGSAAALRRVIDVYQKKADPLAKNAAMGKVLKAVNKSAIAWAAFEIPADMVKMAAAQKPQLKVLEGINGLTLSFDYQNKDVIADIQAMGGAKDNNSQIAAMLNGFKAMGATFAAKQPALVELINTVDVTSGTDYVRLYAKIPDETLKKLQAIAQEKLGGLMTGKPAEPKEEKKTEKK